jgi:hypothetical protein
MVVKGADEIRTASHGADGFADLVFQRRFVLGKASEKRGRLTEKQFVFDQPSSQTIPYRAGG